MKKIFILLLGLCLTAGNAEAKSKKTKQKEAAAAQAKAKAEEAAKKMAEAERPDIDRPGLFKVTKKKGEWFMEIPDSLLGKDLLTTTRFVSTPANCGKFGGEQCNEQVVFFEINPDSTMLLRERMMVNRADTTNQINKAITISNTNPVLGAFKIEKHKDGVSKIKMNFFLNDENPLCIHSSMKSSLKIGAPVRELCYIEDIKSFPTNTEIRVAKTYNTAGPNGGRQSYVLNISFVMLPEVPMMPRYYDPRVGYFTEHFTEYGDEQQRVESKTLIARYRLEPKPEDIEKMKAGELVEPQKPIIYYIDPATPKQWRKYLIQGVNDWQKAFERAGFKNAIRGEEWPEDADSTMSMEDARYCVIRYLASPIENAYGPHVSDPRTGEILESHICWYHNVMALVHDWYMIQAGTLDEAARKMKYDEELMGQLIRFVSSHEVGHSLGLRHNFGSSSTVPVDSLRNKAWVEKYGHTPSIMDYARFNYVAQPEDNISSKGIFPRINDYDMWAIEWGYRPMLDATNPDEDHKLLEPMTAAAQKNPRLWWGDGEGVSGDPRRQTEDLGDDPMKASEYGMRNLKRELKELQSWTVDEKDIYDNNLYSVYNQIRNQFLRYMGHIIRNIGGTYINWRTREEGGTKYEPTPLARQKAALDFVNKNMLTEPTWLRDMPYATSFTNDTRTLTLGIANSAAATLISRLSNTNTLYTAEQFADDIIRLCFTETAGGKPVTLYRETLQKAVVTNFVSMFQSTATNPVAMTSSGRSIALYALKGIQKRLSSATSADAHTRAHYMNLSDMIARTLVIK